MRGHGSIARSLVDALTQGLLAQRETLQGSPTSGCGEGGVRGPARAGCCGRMRDFRDPRQARGNKLQGSGTNRMEQNATSPGSEGSGGIPCSITAAIQTAILLYIAHFQAHTTAELASGRPVRSTVPRLHGQHAALHAFSGSGEASAMMRRRRYGPDPRR